MNCNDLTGEEAFELWKQYTKDNPDWEDQILESGILYSDWKKDPIKYESDDSLIKGSFRGFLYGRGWTVYIGDKYKYYWGRSSLGSTSMEEWRGSGWKDEGYNRFGVPLMRDVTELLCDSSFSFLNWKENPWEVKE